MDTSDYDNDDLAMQEYDISLQEHDNADAALPDHNNEDRGDSAPADSDIGDSSNDSYVLDMTTVEWVNSPPAFILKRSELEPWVEQCFPTARPYLMPLLVAKIVAPHCQGLLTSLRMVKHSIIPPGEEITFDFRVEH